jgi:ribose-phosphate pyrophosphokinase
MDLHAAQLQGFFNIPIDNFRSLPIIAKYMKEKELTDLVVVSPDHGGVARSRMLADVMGAPIAIIDKTRPEPNVAEVMNIIGRVRGKNCIIYDDIIDTGGSVVAAANALKEAGAKDVYACCTHPVMSGDAMNRITNSPISEMVCTDTILLPESKRFPKLVQLSVAGLLGQGIINIIDDQGISSLFQ